jgi:hypothetical protein
MSAIRVHRPVSCAALAALLALAWAAPRQAEAQVCSDRHCHAVGDPALVHAAEHGMRDRAVILGVNAAVGGVTAGVRQRARGGSFWRGFAAGAAGGGLVYTGKWLSAEGFWGAGLAGRQVAAVGASVIRNASEELPLLDHLMLPVGPVRVYVDRSSGLQTHVKLDLASAGVMAFRMASPDARLDASASISTGAPVFVTETVPYPSWQGNNSAGVILLRDQGTDDMASIRKEMVFAHERIHLLQYDHLLHTLSTPVERRLLRRLPGGDWLTRHVDIGLIVVPVLILNQFIPYDDRPWEREAHILSGMD